MADDDLRIEAIADPDAFAGRAGHWLATHAIDANIIGSVLANARRSEPAKRPDDLWFAITGTTGQAVGVAMHTAGRDVFLPELPSAAAELVAAELFARDRHPPGVSGDPEAARAFGTAWHRLSGELWEQDQASLLYVLDTLEPPSDVPGVLHLATDDDADHVTEWANAFTVEAEAPGMSGDQREVVAGRIAADEVFLWVVDDEPAAMAAVSPAVGGVARLNLVYTPPERRGRGFGSAVSAGVTAAALNRGVDVCMLYADVANPASNAVYQRIGYREHGEAVVLRFRPG